MSTQQLCINIGAKSGVTGHKYEGLEINMIPNSPLPISLAEGTRFDANTFGLVLGILWGTLLLVIGLAATKMSLGIGLVEQLSSIHIGYGASVSGAIMGAVCGLIYGFIVGSILARVYNLVLG